MTARSTWKPRLDNSLIVEIVDARGLTCRREPLNECSAASVVIDNRGILIAYQKLDHAILPGLQAGRLPKRSAKLGTLIRWRHGPKHVPCQIQSLEISRHPRQHLEGGLEIVGRD